MAGTPPANMSFPNGLMIDASALKITTQGGEFCVNNRGVATKDFVEQIYNVHTHAPGAPPVPAHTRALDPNGEQVTLCNES
jgi:hypothetical protein